MERPVNSKVRHGMASCAQYGCKRMECIKARRRAHREMEADLRNGVRSAVSSSRAAEHLRLLSISGVSSVDAANRSGVSKTNIQGIVSGRIDLIYRVNEEAILGVPIPVEPVMPEVEGLADAIGARRRLQALAVQGFTIPVIVNETGMTRRSISNIRAGMRPQVRISRLRVIADVHDRLWDEDPSAWGIPTGSVKRAQLWAREQNWLPTEAWTDIDDPDCTPIRKTPRYVALTEDARELIDQQGYSQKTAAMRLGVEPNTLTSAISYYNKAKAS